MPLSCWDKLLSFVRSISPFVRPSAPWSVSRSVGQSATIYLYFSVYSFKEAIGATTILDHCYIKKIDDRHTRQ